MKFKLVSIDSINNIRFSCYIWNKHSFHDNDWIAKPLQEWSLYRFGWL